ncbi:MAG: hypothetical protein ABIJ34_09480 [archaeon]
MNRKILLFFIIFIPHAQAAIISGSVYDVSLSKINNVILEINTSPHQRFVAVNGSYLFEIPDGTYDIDFYYINEGEKIVSREQITVVGEGNYHIDLFPYPVLDTELSDSLEYDIDAPEIQDNSFIIPVLLTLFIVTVGTFFLIFFRKKNILIAIDDDIAKVLSLLKSSGGRMTQKELRNHLPYSEAKVSLIVADLESIGRIRKIKKGRANILILNRTGKV